MGHVQAVFWKNVKYRQRHYVYTLLELLAPILVCVLIVKLPSTPTDEKEGDYVAPVVPKADILAAPFTSYKFNVLFTPNTTQVGELMKKVLTGAPEASFVTFKPVENEEAMLSWFSHWANSSEKLGVLGYGVVFDSEALSRGELVYTLRSTDKLWATNSKFPGVMQPGPMGQEQVYFERGFLALQILINDAFIGSEFDFTMQAFPYPAYHKNNEFLLVIGLVQSLLPLAWLTIVNGVGSKVLEEKMSGTKEWLRMLGLSEGLLAADPFVHSAMVFVPGTLVVSLLLVFNLFTRTPCFPHSSWTVIWLCFVLHCSLLSSFAMAVSALFSTPALGRSITLFLSIGPYSLFSLVSQKLGKLDNGVRMLLVFVPGFGNHWAFEIIGSQEASGEGAGWTNLWSSSGISSGLSLGLDLSFMLLGVVVYVLLYVYIGLVKPGPFGTPRPWHLRLTVKENKASPPPREDDVVREYTGRTATPDLTVRRLCKNYGPVTAVDDLSLDLYKNEITVLLGHNGAGKTTLISMLAGMKSPSSGHIYFNSKQISNASELRQKIGLCPQHNLLYSYLTVEEHLELVGMLRGLPKHTRNDSTRKLLKQFRLEERKSMLVNKLSGGMQRKLCLALAQVGEPPILLLDEPSSGMDPEFRRSVWDLLTTLKTHKVVIISTHFMEEADALADTVVIMDGGRVRCVGSTMFLTKHYQTGYQLRVDVTSTANQEQVKDVVSSSIPSATVLRASDTSVLFKLLPQHRPSFEELFKKLEEDKSLGVRNLALSCTTLEDVFLRVGGNDEVDNYELLDDTNSSNSSSSLRLTGPRLAFQRLTALLLKQLQFYLSSALSYTYTVLLTPCILTAIAMQLTLAAVSLSTPLPSLNLSLTAYPNTEVLGSGSSPELSRLSSLVLQAGCSFTQVTGDLGDELMARARQDESYYRTDMVVALALTGQLPNNAMYSTIALHGPPIALNLLYQVEGWKISTRNWPLGVEDGTCQGLGLAGAILVSTLVSLALVGAASGLLEFHHQEVHSGSKHLQLMTGLGPGLYWASAVLLDLGLLLPCIGLVLGLAGASLSLPLSQLAVFALLLTLGCHLLVWHLSLYSLLSPQLPTAITLFSMPGSLGVFLSPTLLLLGSLAPDSWLLNTLHYVLLVLLPSYPLMGALYKFLEVCFALSQCSLCGGPGCEELTGLEYWSWDRHRGIYPELLAMGLGWLLCLGLLMSVEAGLVEVLWERVRAPFLGPPDTESRAALDPDVEAERTEASNSLKRAVPLPLLSVDLVKQYSRSVTAVKGVSFSASAGQCFGLLGVNGAGKSTTFRMLVGQTLPTAGSAAIFGKHLSSSRSEYLSRVGYCPQSDPLLHQLTGLQVLQLFGRLRGLPPSQLRHQARLWTHLLGLQKYENQRCGEYSGGNRRKLSTAAALIGDPPIVFLDEPTTGVDPIARRRLWAVLNKSKALGQTLVLTSHSMDECEVLCDRLTIMADGKLRCLGSPAHLKSKFGQGYTVTVKTRDVEEAAGTLQDVQVDNAGDAVDGRPPSSSSTEVGRLVERITSALPEAVLKERHAGQLSIHIQDPSCPLSTAFHVLETVAAAHPLVADYVLTDTTLEQVFISFAKELNPHFSTP